MDFLGKVRVIHSKVFGSLKSPRSCAKVHVVIVRVLGAHLQQQAMLKQVVREQLP